MTLHTLSDHQTGDAIYLSPLCCLQIVAAAQKHEIELKTRMWYSPYETHTTLTFFILQETVF